MTFATIFQRYKLIQAMHTVITHLNDERAYLTWITIVPDQPEDDDFKDIAEDTDLYAEACEMFRDLIQEFGPDGFYCAGDKKAF